VCLSFGDLPTSMACKCVCCMKGACRSGAFEALVVEMLPFSFWQGSND
jgi:hypothetical protein